MNGDTERRHTETVLAERARLLARPAVDVSQAPGVELVAFAVAGERYAIDAAYVRRLERLNALTPLPGAPSHFAGITNFHGQLVPMIDLGALLGTAPHGNSTFGIVVGVDRAEFAILADALLEMRALPPGMPAAAKALIRCILPDGCAVIDGAAIIDDPRLVIGERAPDPREESNPS